MKRLFISLVIVFGGTTLFAQKPPVKFGDIPLEDLKMVVYDKDSSAVAVVLVDYGKAYIQSRVDDAVLMYERLTRIKILKKEGLSWADVSIPLYRTSDSRERVTNLKATTYNLENGKIVEKDLEKDGIFEEKFNRNFVRQKFTMPNVKEGSIIEYSYTVNSDFFTNFPNWQFQRDIPVRQSEYWAIFPESFNYEKYMQGYLLCTYEVKSQPMAGYSATSHHWTIKDVPAFKVEPYMACEDDYISRINFALSTVTYPGRAPIDVMGSWETLNKRLNEDEDFGKVIEKSGFLKDKVAEVTAGITDPMAKIEAIHKYVSQTIEWDDVEDFYAGNLKKIIEQKKGTSGDVNLILASMLDKAGFQVEMILLSTREHGLIRQAYPMSRQFNYVICSVKLGDKTLLLDATEKYLPMTSLPERCLNGQGLTISNTFKGWTDVTSKTKAKTLVDGDFTLDETGEMKGRVSYSFDGYDALDMRNSYFKKGEAEYVKDFLSSKTWTVEKTEFDGLKDLTKPAKQIHTMSLAEHGSAAGDVIYLNPFIALQFEKNPFVHEKREYPVDYGASIDRIYFCKITLPEGYAVEELPKSKVIALPGNAGRYIYNIVQAGKLISITSNFQISKSFFLQTEYPVLREFYNQLVAKQAEQIVLKKK